MKLPLSKISVLFLIGIINFNCVKQKADVNSKQVLPFSDNREQYLNWFREAKFGMFIHWGPYSMLEGEWNGKQVPVGRNAEWVMKELKIPVHEYRELAHKMNPVKFNAKEWVRLAKNTGMKYIVITAKHHDGFAMYHSRVSSYNIFDWTPFKRDPLQELAKACEEEGIKFCVYYSHREDWDHPGGYGNNWDYDNDWGMDLYDPVKFGSYLEEKAKPQVKELLTNYGELGLVWFDRGLYTLEQGMEFVNLVNSIQPSALVNGRVGHYDQELLGDFTDMSDKGIPPGGLGDYFQTPQTLNETWGYSKFDTRWKSPEMVIRQLVQVVSRGGNYLLNIGPKGNGEIPAPTVEIFSKVGEWIHANGESIYGTSVSPFAELEWGYCTVKGKRLYLFVRDWPVDNVISLNGLENSVTSAYLLSNKSEVISVSKTEDKTLLTLPVNLVTEILPVIVLELDSSPVVKPSVVHHGVDGQIVLDYSTVKAKGKTVTRFNRKGGFHIAKWTAPGDEAEWILHIDKSGKYRININYAANKEWKGKIFEININKTHIERAVVHTGTWFEFHDFPAGYIEFSEPGEYKLTIRPKTESDTYLMYLRSITLIPVSTFKEEGWGVAEQAGRIMP